MGTCLVRRHSGCGPGRNGNARRRAVHQRLLGGGRPRGAREIAALHHDLRRPTRRVDAGQRPARRKGFAYLGAFARRQRQHALFCPDPDQPEQRRGFGRRLDLSFPRRRRVPGMQSHHCARHPVHANAGEQRGGCQRRHRHGIMAVQARRPPGISGLDLLARPIRRGRAHLVCFRPLFVCAGSENWAAHRNFRRSWENHLAGQEPIRLRSRDGGPGDLPGDHHRGRLHEGRVGLRCRRGPSALDLPHGAARG